FLITVTSMLRYHSQLGYRFDVKLTPIAKPLHFID
ncbi:MAG: hypothetical protein RLZZ184_1044, partial [Cyanobacteriota bacterium]